LAQVEMALLVDQLQSPPKATTLYSALLPQRAVVKAVRLLLEPANTAETAVLAVVVRTKERIAAALETRLARRPRKAVMAAHRRFRLPVMGMGEAVEQARLAVREVALTAATAARELPRLSLAHL
jgi:hypothetical protein